MSLSVELPKKEKAAGLSLSMSPLHKRCIPSRRRPLCDGLYPLGCEPKQTLSLKLLFGVYFISIWKGTNTEAKLFFLDIILIIFGNQFQAQTQPGQKWTAYW